MRYIRIAIGMLCSNMKLAIKKVLGCKVNFGLVNLISPFAHLYSEHGGMITIGNKSGVKSNTEIKANGGEVIIGNNCFVNRNCMIVSHEKIYIEDGVTIGPNTVIYDHDHVVNSSGGYILLLSELEKMYGLAQDVLFLKVLPLVKAQLLGLVH